MLKRITFVGLFLLLSAASISTAATVRGKSDVQAPRSPVPQALCPFGC